MTPKGATAFGGKQSPTWDLAFGDHLQNGWITLTSELQVQLVLWVNRQSDDEQRWEWWRWWIVVKALLIGNGYEGWSVAFGWWWLHLYEIKRETLPSPVSTEMEEKRWWWTRWSIGEDKRIFDFLSQRYTNHSDPKPISLRILPSPAMKRSDPSPSTSSFWAFEFWTWIEWHWAAFSVMGQTTLG